MLSPDQASYPEVSLMHLPLKTGAVYARMSTAMQSEHSPDDQVRVCRERAAADGVSIPDVSVFIDRAVSGTKPDRTALAELNAAALARRFAVLYVEDLSRLSRESSHMMMFLKELVYEDVRIISVNEGIDSASESWHVLATILGLKHEQDIRDLGHRVRRGQKGALLSDYSAGDRCFGYASEPVADASPRRDRNRRIPRRVVVDPAQRAWVVRIFEWFTREKRSMIRIGHRKKRQREVRRGTVVEAVRSLRQFARSRQIRDRFLEAQVHLPNEDRRLEIAARALPPHTNLGHAVQLFVDETQEPIGRAGVPAVDGREQRRDGRSRVLHDLSLSARLGSPNDSRIGCSVP